MHESNLTESNFICVFFVIKVHFRNVARERVQRTTLIENNIDEGMFPSIQFLFHWTFNVPRVCECVCVFVCVSSYGFMLSLKNSIKRVVWQSKIEYHSRWFTSQICIYTCKSHSRLENIRSLYLKCWWIIRFSFGNFILFYFYSSNVVITFKCDDSKDLQLS